MGKALGALVFVAGVAGLGYWGARSHAVSMEHQIRDAARQIASASVHPLDVQVSGRDITITGAADTPAELKGLLLAFDEVRGRRVVNAAGVTVLPEVTPYETAIAKGTNGDLSFAGYAPSAALAATVPGAAALSLGHGAPADWAEVMAAGAAALAPLDQGSFALTGNALTLSGVAATPAEHDAARAALGDRPGFDEVVAIDVLDPGIVDFTLSYDAATGFALAGTLPGNLGPEEVAAALGLDALGGKVGTTFAEVDGLAEHLGALRSFAGELESLTMRGTNEGLEIGGDVLAGLDAGSVQNRLARALGQAATVSLDAPAALPPDGADRVNAATGARQIARGGAWLSKPGFEPSKPACAAAAADTVAARPIQFLTGSAELDPASLATINAVAGIVLHCTEGPGMRVVVGGHTDAEGEETANYALSMARARAVRDALIARGVAAERITAIGYGETEPVADNETEEGRAKNRRTTFDWPE